MRGVTRRVAIGASAVTLRVGTLFCDDRAYTVSQW